MSFVGNLFKSVGVKRSLASLLAAVFAGAIQHPAVAPYASNLLEIVGVLGGAGVVGAAASGNLIIKK